MRKDDFIEYYSNMNEIKDIDCHIWTSNYIIDRLELNDEQILWFCFLTAITYHLPTAYMIINEYPDLELVDEDRLIEWWNKVQRKCPFQKDKLKQRKYLPDSIMSYKSLVGDSQSEYFNNLLNQSPSENFDILWDNVYKEIKHFGRFSTWNWAQSLKQVAGYKIEPSLLFLGENGSESITHGMSLVFGKDEWAIKERYIEDNKRKKRVHKFTEEEKIYLEQETANIISELRYLNADAFTIETVACAYKKLFRERDSRYVGYYLDRQAEDILSIQDNGFNGVDWSILWDARNELLDPSNINIGVNKDKFRLSYNEKLSKQKETEWDNW